MVIISGVLLWSKATVEGMSPRHLPQRYRQFYYFHLEVVVLHVQTSKLAWQGHYSPLSKGLDHQIAADVKEYLLSNFLYILIIFKMTNS